MSKPPVFCGIDPGIEGAVCVICTSTCARCGAQLETETGETKCRCGIVVQLCWPARECDVIEVTK